MSLEILADIFQQRLYGNHIVRGNNGALAMMQRKELISGHLVLVCQFLQMVPRLQIVLA